MAILTKEEFDKRNENAAKRNAENTNIAVENGLPCEIGETLEWLCNRRHWFHCLDVESVYNSESFEYGNFYHFVQKEDDEIIKLEEYFNKPVFSVSQLTIEALPTDYDWNECLDDEEKENIYDDDEEKYRLESLSKIMDFKNNINNQIEKFLADVDVQYKTHYAPTGNQRIY